jgi:hypothetical protein
MAGAKIGGIATLYVDGATFQVRGDFTYRAHTINRETVTGVDAVHGFKESPTAGFIAASISDLGSLTQAQLNKMVDVTVVAELNNGKRVTGRNMWQVGELETNAVEGQLTVRWEGAEVIEEAAG